MPTGLPWHVAAERLLRRLAGPRAVSPAVGVVQRVRAWAMGRRPVRSFR